MKLPLTPWSEGFRNEQKFFRWFLIFIILTLIYAFGIKLSGISGKGIQDSIFYLVDWLNYLSSNRDLKTFFDNVEPRPFLFGLFSSIYFSVALVFMIRFSMYAKFQPYGDSRFATAEDVAEMGLLDKERATGLIVGKFKGKYLSPPFLRHGIALAPTRSGKTAGFVIPTALSFKGTTIITDPKGELEAMLAPILNKTGKKIYSIDWSNENSIDAWNPLSLKTFPSIKKNLVNAERQAERIAALIVPKSTGAKDSHWDDTARRNLSALILFAVREAEYVKELLEVSPENESLQNRFIEIGEPHLGKIYNMIASSDSIQEILNGNANEEAGGLKERLVGLMKKAAMIECPARVIADLNIWRTTPNTEAGSHLSTLVTRLQLWRSAAVRGATRESSFSWPDLRKEDCAVFIKFPQQDAAAYGQLTALFFESLFAWALDVPMTKTESPIVVLADEFGSLPKIELMADFLSKGAGMGAVIWPIVQDFSQIQKVYGKDDYSTIRTNCSYLLVYAQNNEETQSILSKMVGKAAHKKTSVSKQKGGNSTSISDEGISLIDSSKFGDIPFGQHVLLVQNFMTKPVFCQTPLWFKERAFKKMMRKGRNNG